MARTPSGRDERIVWRGHTHAKALVWPALAFLVLAPATGAALAWLPERGLLPGAGGVWVVWGVAGLLVLIGCLLPWWRWLATVYIITDQRVIVRRGLLRRVDQDLPWARVERVSLTRGLFDRLVGAGAVELIPAVGPPLRLADVPRATQLHRLANDLLLATIHQPAQVDAPAAG
ncbi:MAG: PH domain-containing protein [Propionibacteriaceae bacterium]|jgi:membrane protein YdbS with pleckstrin-like domain|nr:PH domain-containing protein [Propionibacteriaceae bacterium]